MLFNIELNNPFWREHLVTNLDYIAFCATKLTAAAIADNRYLQSEPESATPERVSFNERIIEKAAQFSPLYAQITAASIELAEHTMKVGRRLWHTRYKTGRCFLQWAKTSF